MRGERVEVAARSANRGGSRQTGGGAKSMGEQQGWLRGSREAGPAAQSIVGEAGGGGQRAVALRGWEGRAGTGGLPQNRALS